MTSPSKAWPGDVAALERELRRAVRGSVRFDAGSRALFATDASNFRQVPIGVVSPLDGDDVEAALAACRRHQAPVLPRGGGTSLAGQCCNVAVVLDTSCHLGGILELDPAGRRARVLPGTVLDDLRDAAAPHGLTFGPDPATHAWCTLGGMIGNNSCGVHSLTAGRTSDNVEELEIATYDGLRLHVGPTTESELSSLIAAGGRRAEIYRALRDLRDRYAGAIRAGFPKLARRVSGYNLDDLLPENGFHLARALVGSEGTCATLLSATLRLVHRPAARVLVVLGFPDVLASARAVPRVLAFGPEGLEGMDRFLVENDYTRHLHKPVLDRLPPGDAWLLVEMGGESRAEAAARGRDLAAGLAAVTGSLLVEDATAQRSVWLVREAAVGTTSRDPRLGDGWPGWEDAAVPPERLADYLEALYTLLDRNGYKAALYGHFGEGCLHARINFDFSTPAGVARYRGFMEEAADLVTRFGGSLSGEHGDGQQRGELLERMFGPELVEAFRAFKRIWDPGNRMNPGKKVDPLPLDADLRPALPLAHPRTAFAFAEDQRDFARAVTRCVGVGRCRSAAGGTMCPSYRATGEEGHSTRGRARLLFEMLAGEVVTDSWESGEVEEALDLCLGCKACRSECPAGVDMAAYKAEFRYRHYRGRLRPRSAYALGRVATWLRLGSLAPGAVNALASGGASSRALKWIAGIHPERALPPLAEETFGAWFSRRPAADETKAGTPVVLWVDTFSQHLEPGIARAAVAVLERAGYRVTIPTRPLCCGRPLYDYGFLDEARRGLLRVLAALAPAIAAETPVVVLEPSCLAAFRDELLQLFPRDPAAKRLSRIAVSLAELLTAKPGPARPKTSWTQDQAPRRLLVHGHCHQKALGGMGAERELFARLGVEAEVLDSGCCGMAGAFGFERRHYEVSLACGEHSLLPAARTAGATPLLADGFSCREQVSQSTGRRPLHLAEWLVDLPPLFAPR